MSETPEQRSRTMRAVRSRDTGPEMIVRRFLHAAGLRFRLHDRRLPGVPDLVFPSRRVVLFVHGCFWHQHPGCPAAARPKSRPDYWNRKLDMNVTRDARCRFQKTTSPNVRSRLHCSRGCHGETWLRTLLHHFRGRPRASSSEAARREPACPRPEIRRLLGIFPAAGIRWRGIIGARERIPERIYG